MERFDRGAFRFPVLLKDALEPEYDVDVREDHPLLKLTFNQNQRALFHQMVPFSSAGLVFRTAFRPPFWRIEASPRRWEWSIAANTFEPGDASFAERLRERFSLRPSHGGGTVIALQGDLTEHRQFQSMSPIEMVRATMKNTKGPVVAAVHPRARYTTRELSRLEAVALSEPRLTIQTGADPLLPQTGLLVTQNSTVGILALLMRIPVVLFARADFHHGCAVVQDLGVEEAFRVALQNTWSHDAYTSWFFQTDIIRAGQPDVRDQIRKRIRALGWSDLGD